MTEFSGLTRRDFMLQTAVLAGSMLVGGKRPLGGSRLSEHRLEAGVRTLIRGAGVAA